MCSTDSNDNTLVFEWSLVQILWQSRLRTTGNDSERAPNCPNRHCAKKWIKQSEAYLSLHPAASSAFRGADAA